MSVNLEWNNEQNEWPITEQWIQKLEELLQVASEVEQISSGVVSLSFVDDQTIQLLNEQYRGINQPTDVLSFPMNDGEDDIELIAEENLLGDIVISVTTAKAQSDEYGHSLEREMGFLFVHGLLHLLGYDHEDESSEKMMFEKQEFILQKAGLFR